MSGNNQGRMILPSSPKVICSRWRRLLCEGRYIQSMVSYAVDKSKRRTTTSSTCHSWLKPTCLTTGSSSFRTASTNYYPDCIFSANRLLFELFFLIFSANVNSRSRRHVRYMLSPARLSVTLVHPTQPVEIFGNVSTPFGTLATR